MENKKSICFNCKKFNTKNVIDGCYFDRITNELKFPSLDQDFQVCVEQDPIIPAKSYEEIHQENISEINFIKNNKDNEDKMNDFVPHVDEIETPEKPKIKGKPLEGEDYEKWKQELFQKTTNRDKLYKDMYGMTEEEFRNKMKKDLEEHKQKEEKITSNEDMLKGYTEISHFEQITPWKRALNAARRTIGKEQLDKEPSKSWEAKILLAEHSPIRLVEYDFGWKKIRQWVTAHMVRHHEGCEKFVHSQRGDRRKLPCDRDHIYQGAKNDMDMSCNAQAMINISRKRLCSCASQETREAWKQVMDELEKVDPVLRSKCVKECVYRGFCPEFMGSCGYYKTDSYKKELAKYRCTKYGKDVKYYCVMINETNSIIVSNTGHVYYGNVYGTSYLNKEGLISFEEIQHYQLTEYKYEINKSINGDELCITNPIIPVSSLVVACFSEVPYYENVRKVEGHIRSTYNQMEIIKHIDGNIYNNDIDNLITNCENTI